MFLAFFFKKSKMIGTHNSLKTKGREVQMKKWFSQKFIVILIQIAILYLISILGEMVSSFFKLPIPGSIVGLLFLFLCLQFKIIPERYVKEGAGFLLVLLPLFLLPATVGIIQFPVFLSLKGILLIGTIMTSTFITMIVVGRVSEHYEAKKIQEEL